MEDKLLYRDEVYAIQGALFDVYKTMGNMWGEEVYQQCLEKELSLRNIPFEAKKELPIFYKGEKIEKSTYGRPTNTVGRFSTICE